MLNFKPIEYHIHVFYSPIYKLYIYVDILKVNTVQSVLSKHQR